MKIPSKKIKISVHKFSSCDGCQLAFLNSVNTILKLSEWIDIIHFAEAGPYNLSTLVDIAFIEGSISTDEDIERLKNIRRNSSMLVSIGACATSGGLQALRNLANHQNWMKAIYPQSEYIDTLDRSTAISQHVGVDYELWGCPVDSKQLFSAIQAWLTGSKPKQEFDNVCSECKNKLNSCVLVSKGKACMGPVTRRGCGAICPSFNRECYGCYGPATLTNTSSLTTIFKRQGLSADEISKRFLAINNHSKDFLAAGLRLKQKS
jgi:sulfhydrogenase subunit delta